MKQGFVNPVGQSVCCSNQTGQTGPHHVLGAGVNRASLETDRTAALLLRVISPQPIPE